MTCCSTSLYRLSVIRMGKFCSSGLLFTWFSGHIILLGPTAQAHCSTEPLHIFWALMLSKKSFWYDLFLYPHYSWFCTLRCVLPLWCFWPLDWFFYPSLVKNSLFHHWINKASSYIWPSSDSLLGCLALKPDPSNTLMQRPTKIQGTPQESTELCVLVKSGKSQISITASRNSRPLPVQCIATSSGLPAL